MSDGADIGVIGGSGFYRFFEDVEEQAVATPYGPPSDAIFIATVDGRRVAFLPRHGRHHSIPPHRINYRANIWALKHLGVRHLISPCAVGSLQAAIAPGHFVVCDQYVDRTTGRADTFFDGPEVSHVSAAHPYCPLLRELAGNVIRSHGVTVHERGTIVVINGPRFSTTAESRWFSDAGWDVVGMTQYPEVHLALEAEIAVVTIALVTDYDSGVAAGGAVTAVTADAVREVFAGNSERIRGVVLDMCRRIELEADSPCHHSLRYARISA